MLEDAFKTYLAMVKSLERKVIRPLSIVNTARPTTV